MLELVLIAQVQFTEAQINEVKKLCPSGQLRTVCTIEKVSKILKKAPNMLINESSGGGGLWEYKDGKMCALNFKKEKVEYFNCSIPSLF